jgi:hypothetical protein
MPRHDDMVRILQQDSKPRKSRTRPAKYKSENLIDAILNTIKKIDSGRSVSDHLARYSCWLLMIPTAVPDQIGEQTAAAGISS